MLMIPPMYLVISAELSSRKSYLQKLIYSKFWKSNENVREKGRDLIKSHVTSHLLTDQPPIT